MARTKLNRASTIHWWLPELFDAKETAWINDIDFILDPQTKQTVEYYTYSTPTTGVNIYVPTEGGNVYFKNNNGEVGAFLGTIEKPGSGYYDNDLLKVYSDYINKNGGYVDLDKPYVAPVSTSSSATKKLASKTQTKKTSKTRRSSGSTSTSGGYTGLYENGGILNSLNTKFFLKGGRFVRRADGGMSFQDALVGFKKAQDDAAALARAAQELRNNTSDYDLLTQAVSNWKNFAGNNGHMGRREARNWMTNSGLNLTDEQLNAYRDYFNSGNMNLGVYDYATNASKVTPAQLLAQLAAQQKETWYKQNYVNSLKSQAADKFSGITDQASLQKFLVDLQASGAYDVNSSKVNMKLVNGAWGANSLGAYNAYLDTLTNPYERLAFQDAVGKFSGNMQLFNKAGNKNSLNGEFNAGTATKGFDTYALGHYNNNHDTNGDNIDDYDAYKALQMANSAMNAQKQKTQAQWSGVQFKNGGNLNMTNINYFQEGGAVAPTLAAPAPAEQQGQDIQAQVIQLVLAAMSGDEKATLAVQQIMQAAELGDQQAMQLAQMILEIAKQMQGLTQAAKRGAKLSYLRSLKTGCPEGYEVSYHKEGGHICKECIAKASFNRTGGPARRVNTSRTQTNTKDTQPVFLMYNPGFAMMDPETHLVYFSKPETITNSDGTQSSKVTDTMYDPNTGEVIGMRRTMKDQNNNTYDTTSTGVFMTGNPEDADPITKAIRNAVNRAERTKAFKCGGRVKKGQKGIKEVVKTTVSHNTVLPNDTTYSDLNNNSAGVKHSFGLTGVKRETWRDGSHTYEQYREALEKKKKEDEAKKKTTKNACGSKLKRKIACGAKATKEKCGGKTKKACGGVKC